MLNFAKVKMFAQNPDIKNLMVETVRYLNK